jgi:integrase
MSAKVVGKFKHQGKSYSFYQKTGNPNLYIRIQHQGKPRWKCLDTSEKKPAAIRAGAWIDSLFASKWDVLETLKTRNDFATIGEITETFLANVRHLGIKHVTALGYVVSLRNILSDALGTNDPESLKSTVLTGETLNKFVAVSRQAGRPDWSISGQIGQARSILKEREGRMEIYSALKLPDLTSWRNAKWAFAVNTKRGFVPFSTQQVIDLETAAAQLYVDRNPVWIAYTLMSLFGLRNSMVFNLKKSDFTFDDNQIRFTVKGDYAEAKAVEHTISRETYEKISTFFDQGEYVVPGHQTSRKKICNERICAFMKRYVDRTAEGERKKAYLLRRQAGTVKAYTENIFAAQAMLGHKSVKTTENDYGPRVLRSAGISPDDILKFYRIEERQAAS